MEMQTRLGFELGPYGLKIGREWEMHMGLTLRWIGVRLILGLHRHDVN